MGLLREQYAEWKKVRLQYCCNQVWMKNGGQIPYFCERSVKNPSIGRESLTWIVPWVRFVRGGNLEGWHIGLQTLMSWKRWTHEKSTLKTQCEGSNISQRNGKLIFLAADGRIKLSGGDEKLRTSTLIREHPIRGEGQRDFLGESEGSPPPPPQDSFPDACEAINDFWSMSGNFIYRHHVESRVKLYSPREESFLFPLKYMDVTRTTHTNLDLMQESRIEDYWHIDESRDLSDSWTGFLCWKKNLLTDICGPEGDWQNGKLHPGQIICGQNSGRNWEEMVSWGRSENGPMKNRNSTKPEDYKEFIQLTLRRRN